MAAAGVAAAAVGVRNFLSLGDELDKMRQRTGISVEALSELRHAAKQSGASLGDVEKGVRRMQKGLVDANNGLATSQQAFSDLGLSARELAQQSPEQQFDAIAKAIGSVEDPSRRAGLAMNVFGKSGTALLPMIEQMDQLRQEARDLGFVMSGEAAASAVRVGDQFANLWETLKMGSVAIGQAVAPFLEEALPVIQAFATVGLQTIQGWAQGLSETVGTVANYVSSVWGTLLDWWQTAQTAAMSTLVYLTNNWQVLLETAMVSAQLSVVRFANQTIYFFGTAIPGYLSWFGDNWREVFTDIASMTATVATNIWNNLKNLWDGIVGLFSGEGFSFEWTPLTQGFESAIKELPKIAEREIGPLEKSLQGELDKLGDQVVQGIEQHKKDMPALAKEFVAAGDPIAALLEKQKSSRDAGSAAVAGATPGAGQAKSQVFSTFSAAAAVAAGQGGGSSFKDVIKQSDEKRAKENQKLIQEIRNTGGLVA